MRRMISQKQIEGLENLNNTFTVDDHYLNIWAGENEIATFGIDAYNRQSIDIGFEDVARIGIHTDVITLTNNGAQLTLSNDGGGIVSSQFRIDAYNDDEEGVGAIEVSTTGVTIDPDLDGMGYGYIKLLNLPTSDPHVANAIWNDNGTLKISSGS